MLTFGKTGSYGLLSLESIEQVKLTQLAYYNSALDIISQSWVPCSSWKISSRIPGNTCVQNTGTKSITLANRNARQYINVTKVNPNTDCFTDHKLVIAKCCFVIKKRRKIKPQSRLDTSLNAEKKEKHELSWTQLSLDVINLGMLWRRCCGILHSTFFF